MSFQAMTWAVEQRLPANQKLVLLMLANFAGNHLGDCYPSHERLADDCGMSKTTVKECIRRLEEAGLVTVQRRMQDGVNLPNVYRLALHSGGAAGAPGVGRNPTYPAETGQGVGRPTTEGRAAGGRGVGREATTNQSFQPVIEPVKNQYPPDFEQAWSAYPSRPGASKADAFKAWTARIKAGVDGELILLGVRRYAAYVAAMETQPQYIKQPATFFGPGEHYASDWTPQATLTAMPQRVSPRDAERNRVQRELAAMRDGNGEAKYEERDERTVDVAARVVG